MFHLLSAFPINMAEQEKYYFSNVLRKPLRINVRQFVWQVEQLNAYIAKKAVLLLHPQRKCRHQARERFVHGG
jgi:hypothetical protein